MTRIILALAIISLYACNESKPVETKKEMPIEQAKYTPEMVVNLINEKSSSDPVNATLTNNLKNINPTFNTVDVNKNIFDFRITKDAAAPGINKGIATSFAKDLDDKARSVGLPDIGCYEKQ